MSFLIIILVILLFPLPIKLKIIYDEKFSFYVYDIKINFNKNIVKRTKSSKNKKAFKPDINKTLNVLNNNKLKPYLIFKLQLNYGFDDAAITGLSYGLFSAVFPYIHMFLKNIFKLRKFRYNINPDFNSKALNLRIDSIFLISLVKIIYIFIILLKANLNTEKFKLKNIYRGGLF